MIYQLDLSHKDKLTAINRHMIHLIRLIDETLEYFSIEHLMIAVEKVLECLSSTDLYIHNSFQSVNKSRLKQNIYFLFNIFKQSRHKFISCNSTARAHMICV